MCSFLLNNILMFMLSILQVYEIKSAPNQSLCTFENLDVVACFVQSVTSSKQEEHCASCEASSGRGNEAYGPTSTAPSKTDIRKQTKWQQTWGVRGEEGGRYCTEVECFHVLIPHKQELFPLLRCERGWYCPWHSRGRKKQIFSENVPLMGSLCCYTLWFFTAVESVSLQGWMAAACDDIFKVRFSSCAGLLSAYYKISGVHQQEMSKTEVCPWTTVDDYFRIL